MSCMNKPFARLAAALAGIYLVLAVFSVACALDHTEPQTSRHHHGGTVAHSSVCAWACQANPTSDTGPSTLVLQPILLVALFVDTNHTVLTGGPEFLTASRAPPVQS